MFVRSQMVRTPITVNWDQSIPDAQSLMTLHNVKHLPVMDGDRVVGVVSRTDIAHASPSSASSLSFSELTYILAKTKIKNIMTKNLVSIGPDALLEEAATLMRDKGTSFLPVLEDGRLVGVITESGIFDAFIDLLGFRMPGTRLTIEVQDKGPGVIEEIAGIFADFNASIHNIAVFRSPDDRCDIVVGTIDKDTDAL
ncbi:MAG: CBS and ACT domain-containing protein, partial [Oscillospiraceae bacterium]